MDPKEALELLLETARLQDGSLQPEEHTAATKLLQELNYRALAVVQCGAFIYRTQCSITHYYETYLEEHRANLEGNRVTPLDTEDHERLVYTTVTLNLKLLDVPHDQLWRLLGCLHRNGISEQIFQRAYQNAEKYRLAIPATDSNGKVEREISEVLKLFASEAGAWSSRRFVLAMSELVSLSLVTLDTVNNLYHIHPLAQQWARTTARKPIPLESAAFLLTLSIDRDYDNEDGIFRRIMAYHVHGMLAIFPARDSHYLWRLIAVYLKNGYRIGAIGTRMVQTRGGLGHQQLNWLKIMATLAAMYHDQGQLELAQNLRSKS